MPRWVARIGQSGARMARAVASLPPRVHMGIAVDADTVFVVALRRGQVAWGVEAPIPPHETLADIVRASVVAVPGRRWLMPDVVVALGPSRSQTKRLAGLPPLADRRLLTHAVQAHAGRFFLKNGIPLVTSTVRPVDDAGTTATGWAAAFEQPTVSAIVSACRQAGARVRAVVPAVDVVARGLVGVSDETLIWLDGASAMAVSWSDGRLVGARRVGETARGPALVPVPALAVLGDAAPRFAAAYGAAIEAAMVAESTTLAYRILDHDSDSDERGWSRARLVALGAAIVSLAAAVAAPGVAARRAEGAGSRQLTELASRSARARATEADLARVSAALGEVAAFDSGGRSMVETLAAVARALPAGAAVMALHADSGGGSLVAVASRAGGSAVLAALDRVPELVGPEIVGPVTREQQGGHEVERVTVRFKWAGMPPASRLSGGSR
jgi:hypothetical protein